jgi:hypothetical protein
MVPTAVAELVQAVRHHDALAAQLEAMQAEGAGLHTWRDASLPLGRIAEAEADTHLSTVNKRLSTVNKRLSTVNKRLSTRVAAGEAEGEGAASTASEEQDDDAAEPPANQPASEAEAAALLVSEDLQRCQSCES